MQNKRFTLTEVFLPYCAGKCKAAFTLSEVLITLAIIGVVAALTVNVLFTNYQKHVAINQLKFAYNMFSQVITSSKVDHGDKLVLTQAMLNNTKLFENSPEISSVYFDPYIKNVKKYSGKQISIRNASKNADFIIKYTNTKNAPMCVLNGVCYWIFGQYFPDGNYLPYLYLAVDVNGIKGPNTAGKDVFVFALSLSDTNSSAKSITYDKLVFPYNSTMNFAKDRCNKASVSYYQPYWNGVSCSTLIMYEGYKIPSKYPW